MGCNCKKKTYDKLKKYADNRDEIEKEEYELNHNLINKIARFIAQIIFGIIASVIFIVVVIPLVLYIIFCILTGKEPKIIIKSPKNYFKRNAGKQQ